jgi:hypothetical protein
MTVVAEIVPGMPDTVIVLVSGVPGETQQLEGRPSGMDAGKPVAEKVCARRD